MKNVRLVDIANELNITKVSVSKALRNHSDISEDTRDKVKKMAKKLGYRPNQVARSLTSSKSKTIGVIIPKIAHFFFASVMEGIYREAKKNGYEIFLGVSFENEEQENKLLETMMEMRVDGLLISLTEQTKDLKRFKEIRKMGIDLVFFDRGIKESGFSYIRAEDRKSAQKGVKKLIDMGYTDIAHLAGYSYSEIGLGRKNGFLDAMKEADFPVSESAIIEGGFSEADGFRGFHQLIETHGVPEAIFTATYPVGLGALKCMKQNNIDPNDVKVLSFGRSDFNDYLEHPFICIDQPTQVLGEKATQQLLKEMTSENSTSPELIELPSNV